MRIIDPYREENKRLLEWLANLSDEEGEALLKKAGIVDARGNLARKYRTPKSAKPAKAKTAKSVTRKRTAS